MSELTIEELTFLLEKRPLSVDRKLVLQKMLLELLKKDEDKHLREMKEISLGMVDDSTPAILHEEIWKKVVTPLLKEMGKRDDLFGLMANQLATSRRIQTFKHDIEMTEKCISKDNYLSKN